MTRVEFGKLVAALRQERVDRRNIPWSRQKFAEESKVDREILINIEIGRKAFLYPDILVKMANTLKLTSGERREFFLAASGVGEEHTCHKSETPKKALEDMLAIMDTLRQPALLVDQYFDIAAINFMAMEAYSINPGCFVRSNTSSIIQCNLIRFLFSPEFDAQKAMFDVFKDRLDANVVTLFRAASLRYRATEYFEKIIPYLYEFNEFKVHFQRQRKLQEERYTDNVSINLGNQKPNALRATSSSITATSTAGELRLFMFKPLNEETSRMFSNLTKQENYVFQSLPKWPNKDELSKK